MEDVSSDGGSEAGGRKDGGGGEEDGCESAGWQEFRRRGPSPRETLQQEDNELPLSSCGISGLPVTITGTNSYQNDFCSFLQGGLVHDRSIRLVNVVFM
jgi:hypothetical protein